MPEFIGLRRGTFAVAVAYQNQRGRSGLLDKGNGRTFRVYLGIVIHRRAEEWDQPLIDLILSIVALEVCQSGAGNGGGKAIRLRNRPHGHVAAITPSRNAEAMLVNRRLLERLIHSSHDVAEISVAK